MSLKNLPFAKMAMAKEAKADENDVMHLTEADLDFRKTLC